MCGLIKISLKVTISNLIIFLVSFGLVLTIPESGVAQEKAESQKCECAATKTLDAETEQADLVFVGQAIEIRPKFPLHPGYMFVRFLPLKKYKGFPKYPNRESVVIYLPQTTDPCSLKVSKGNDYLIFAKGNPAFLKANKCGLNGLQEERFNQITELEAKTR